MSSPQANPETHFVIDQEKIFPKGVNAEAKDDLLANKSHMRTRNVPGCKR